MLMLLKNLVNSSKWNDVNIDPIVGTRKWVKYILQYPFFFLLKGKESPLQLRWRYLIQNIYRCENNIILVVTISVKLKSKAL